MGSWCCFFLAWTVPCIGMYSCRKSCLRFSSRVLQPAGPLHWKCLELRTFHRHTAECLMSCGLTQWLWFGTCWWGVEWEDTLAPLTPLFWTSVSTSRGFSAGSFAGLSTLQLLWKIPNVVTNGKLGAIACPPQLIVTPPVAHTLHLLHYEADQLCVWKPGQRQLV